MSRPSVYKAQSSILFLIFGEGSKTYFIECPKKLASNVCVKRKKNSLEKRKERPRTSHVLKREKITATRTGHAHTTRVKKKRKKN
tara:strand:+ start:216 stop:470 length:255 start_codon:yes stop_codon:yes gene_type:complete